MNARDEILSDVRRALTGANPPRTDVSRAYRRTPPAHLDVVGLFVERVEDYRAVVVRCSADEVEQRIADALPEGARVVVPDGLAWTVPSATVDDDFDAYALGTFDVIVTGASVAIAETGTIVLSHDSGEGRRALTLVPDVHICVVRADQVVPNVPDAVALLDPVRPMTWISGPSATSDIELQRVEGVHGPRTLHVIVVG